MNKHVEAALGNLIVACEAELAAMEAEVDATLAGWQARVEAAEAKVARVELLLDMSHAVSHDLKGSVGVTALLDALGGGNTGNQP